MNGQQACARHRYGFAHLKGGGAASAADALANGGALYKNMELAYTFHWNTVLNGVVRSVAITRPMSAMPETGLSS